MFKGVYIGLVIDGDNTTIDRLTPSLSVNVLPSSLSYALRELGIKSFDAIVTISVVVPGQVISQYLRNCYDIAVHFVNLTKDIIEQRIRTIYA